VGEIHVNKGSNRHIKRAGKQLLPRNRVTGKPKSRRRFKEQGGGNGRNGDSSSFQGGGLCPGHVEYVTMGKLRKTAPCEYLINLW